MPHLPCKICGTSFYAKPRHILLGWGKYCSKECQYQGQHNGKFFVCKTCDKQVYRTPKETRGSKSKNFFCNKSCFAVWKNQNLIYGEKHGAWKHGMGSYRNIMLRNKIPQVCAACGHADKRVLLVHHVDRNRKNNHLNNLKYLCRNCHYIEHGGKTV